MLYTCIENASSADDRRALCNVSAYIVKQPVTPDVPS